ncbi:MAG: hypothetical protein KAW12_04280 [Candidatus Aminicenantes bacterium]|nr:hypothetical protein [Candidatus Aminicenantes bacterium]
MKKLFVFIILSLLVISSLPLEAQRYYRSRSHRSVTNQSLNLKLGLFQPTMDSDLWEVNMENLALNKQDMQNVYFGIEYEKFFNRLFSFSIEIGCYYKEHFSQYTEYEYDDGTPIYQDLSLKIVPVELNINVYPLGYRGAFSPFFGGGVGIYAWRYEQWGDFINFEDGSVSEGYADTKAFTPGFNAKAGFVFKVGRAVGVSFSVKYQYLKGELSSLFEGFAKFDLTGIHYSFGLNLFF